MARLARAGQKESKEFKALEKEVDTTNVIDYGGVIRNIVETVKHL